MQHFSRKSIYEGGVNGEENEIDFDQMDAEEDEMMRLLGDNTDTQIIQAKEQMVKSITSQGKKYDIEGYNLHDIEFMQVHKWHILQEVNLSFNMLTNIDVLEYFPNIRVINASNCYIQEFKCDSLKQLRNVDLSDNNIKVFPNFYSAKYI